jgi:hypothetical protein
MPRPATPLFDSPEEAAMQDFPAAHCRIVASRVQGNAAYVLLDTGPPEYMYLYGVNCVREAGGWRDSITGNGPGWAIAQPEEDVGTLSLWSEAPPGADRVRVEFEGRVTEEPIENGTYLAVWWNVPFSDEDWPRVLGFRMNGQWSAGPSGR